MKKSALLLLHLGYWICYLFILIVLVIFLQQRFIFRGFSLFIFLSVFALVPAMLGFYSFYTLLFTRFLKQKKIISLVMGALIIAVGCGCLGWLLLDLVWKHIGPAVKAALNQGGSGEFGVLMTIASVNALLNGATGLIMRGFVTGMQILN